MDETTDGTWRVLGAAGGVRAEQAGPDDAPTWAIGGAAARLRLGWRSDVGLVVRGIEGLSVDLVGDASAPTTGFHLDRAGAATPRLLGAEANADATGDPGSVTLTVRMGLGDDRVGVHVRAYDGLAVLEQWLSVAVAEPATLREAVPLRLRLAAEAVPTLATVAGVQGQGGGSGENGPYRSFRLERRELSSPVRLDSGSRSTSWEMPWFALLVGEGGVFGGLEYSGSWQLRAGYDAGSGSATVSLAPEHLAPELAAGETWDSPRAFVGVFRGNLDDAAAAQHDYHRRVLAPSLPSDFPWVQYNTWFAYLCDLDLPTLTRQVEIAAELGVELFYVDAGWWAESPRPQPGREEDFTTGLGTWAENRDKFPDGLRGFGDLVRSRGMRFGLWVEPERVDLRTATTGTWRTDWLASNADGFVLAGWPPDTDAGWLCFGHEEVQTWALAWIGALIERNGLRWLKWDSNAWGICTRSGHGHGPGDGEAAQVAGVHAVLGALRARFPDLVIENCAGGGTRMDFGMARHAHVHWLNDASTPGHRVRFHVSGASYLMPPAVLTAWLVESPFENLQGQSPPEPILRAMVRSRMLNAFGLSCRLDGWTDETKRIVGDEIAAFKTYRHLLRDGYVSHLLPQPDLESPWLATPRAWEAFQVRSGDGAEAVVLAFRNTAVEEEIVLSLAGLDPKAAYRVTDENGGVGTVPGAELTERGLRVGVPPLASARYRIERVGAEKA